MKERCIDFQVRVLPNEPTCPEREEEREKMSLLRTAQKGHIFQLS